MPARSSSAISRPSRFGDYAAGPSHVLPTGGTARYSSGLTANDFLRCSSVMSFTARGMRHLAEDVVRVGRKEGLTGHAASVSVRMGETKLPRPPAEEAGQSSDLSGIRRTHLMIIKIVSVMTIGVRI